MDATLLGHYLSLSLKSITLNPTDQLFILIIIYPLGTLFPLFEYFLILNKLLSKFKLICNELGKSQIRKIPVIRWV